MTTVADVDLSSWVRQSASPILDGVHTNTVRSGVRQNLIHEDLFDGGTLDLTRYYGSGNTPYVGTFEDNGAMVVSLDRATDTTSYRTEVVSDGWAGTTGFTDSVSAEIGATTWYGLSIYIPSDFILDTVSGGYGTGEIITQWHGQPDVGAGENYRNPNVALAIVGNQYKLSIKADTKEITPPNGTANRYTRTFEFDFGDVTADSIGKWTNWVWRIKWGYDNTGELDLYKDGVIVHTETGLGNCYNDPQGPYMKFGLYKFPWKDNSSPTGVTSRLYYFDNFRVGNSNATLSDVWEDHS